MQAVSLRCAPQSERGLVQRYSCSKAEFLAGSGTSLLSAVRYVLRGASLFVLRYVTLVVSPTGTLRDVTLVDLRGLIACCTSRLGQLRAKSKSGRTDVPSYQRAVVLCRVTCLTRQGGASASFEPAWAASAKSKSGLTRVVCGRLGFVCGVTGGVAGLGSFG